MSKAAKSVLFFAGYLSLIGVTLLVSPNLLLGLFGFPLTEEVWIRLVGMFLLYLSFYYTEAARQEWIGFLRASVTARASVILFFASFVVLGYAPPVLLLFGVVDLASALWTFRALRQAPMSALA